MEKLLSSYLNYLSRYISKKLNAYDHENGISTQDCVIVDFIYERYEQGLDTIQKDIEDEFYFPKAVASEIITSLEKRGYIERVVDTNDQRKKIIKISEYGLKIHEFNLIKVKKFDELMTKKLKKKDLDMLFKLLEEIVSKIKEEEHEVKN